jgi:hypothetical protein
MKYVDVGLPAGSFSGNGSLKSVDAPNVTEIADGGNSNNNSTDGGFRRCKSLETVNLPDVTYIGNYAFDQCTSLKTVNIPRVQTIGTAAFWQCTSLTTLYIPEVTSIGHEAFEQCTSLTTLYLGAIPPVLTGSQVFQDTGSTNSPLTIYVPSGTLNAYLTKWGLSSSDDSDTSKEGIQIAAGDTRSERFGTNHKAISIEEGTYPLNP